MSHNPEKNKAVCVIAKTSMWGMRLFAGTLGGLGVLGLIGAIWSRWSWGAVRAILIWLVILAAGVAISCLIGHWYEWAKNYAKDC